MTRWVRRALGLTLVLGGSALPTPAALAQDATAKNDQAFINQLGVAQDYEKLLLATVRDPVDDPMGATFEPVSDPLRAQLALPADQGLIVAALANEGPAARAGLLQNDILLTLADKPLTKAADLTDQLQAGDKAPLPLKLLRAGKPITLSVRPAYRVTLAAADKKGNPDYYIGIGVEPLDDALRAHLNLPDGQGLLANQIVEGSPAEKAGVKTHDILLDLGDKPLDSTETLISQVQAAKGKSTTLKLVRAGKPLSITITPEPRKQPDETFVAHERLYRLGVQAHPELLRENVTGFHAMNQPLRLWMKDGQAHGWHGMINATGQPDNLGARLDALDTDLKALRKAVEEIRDVLKKDK